jgi:hypothetical protein
VDELTAGQAVELFGGRLAPQDDIAMGVAAEAGDDVAMGAGLGCRVLQDPAHLRRRLCHELVGELDGLVRVREILGVPRGRKKVFSQGVFSAA